MSTFTAECYQNEYLPLGGTEVNAIVTVTSDGAAGEASQPEAAEIVIVDTSGSMGAPRREDQGRPRGDARRDRLHPRRRRVRGHRRHRHGARRISDRRNARDRLRRGREPRPSARSAG